MNTHAQMKIGFVSNYAKRIHLTITPDNKPLPPGIELVSEVKGKHIEITIECKRGIDSLWATLEDILSAIDLSMKTITKIKY